MTDEAEQHRQDLLQELDAREDIAPGSFGCHELLDRTALVMRLIEGPILEHPACVNRPDWFQLAHEAAEALGRLYQQIGSEHLTAPLQSSTGSAISPSPRPRSFRQAPPAPHRSIGIHNRQAERDTEDHSRDQ